MLQDGFSDATLCAQQKKHGGLRAVQIASPESARGGESRPQDTGLSRNVPLHFKDFYIWLRAGQCLAKMAALRFRITQCAPQPHNPAWHRDRLRTALPTPDIQRHYRHTRPMNCNASRDSMRRPSTPNLGLHYQNWLSQTACDPCRESIQAPAPRPTMLLR